MRMRAALALLVAGLFALCLGPAGARAAGLPSAPSSAAERCAALKGSGLNALADAPTEITAASFKPAVGPHPAYCELEGYVSPTVGFGMMLPADNWNGKFIERGCGGFCGIVATAFACLDHVTRGYACVQTDMGHKSTMVDSNWAVGNLQGIIDFAYRSTHVTAVAGKALVEAFYRRSPAHSYFMGCSTGGRQAMVSAERFPDDFDGIVSVAPAIAETGAGLQLLWSVRANLDARGHAILPPAKLGVLHDAVIAACDMNDGIKDGLIGDPRQCRFDPASLLCHAGDAPNCLTRDQLAVVRKIYEGPRNSAGAPLYTGGAQPGSELGWAGHYVGTDDQPASYAGMMDQFWRGMAFSSPPPANWDAVRDFNFDRDPPRIGGMESLYSGSNVDLRGFARRGGKLILAQGWNDTSVVPLNALDYYQGVTRFMGGPAATSRFFRLFTIPGMEHCQGGPGAWHIDYLSVLDAWVAGHQAPDLLVGEHPRDGLTVPWLGAGPTLQPRDVVFRRPILLYPAAPLYKGHGDPDDPASYTSR